MNRWTGILKILVNQLSRFRPILSPLSTLVATENREKRRYDRFSPLQNDLVTATFSNGTRAFVSNLSYGGFGCSTSPYFPDFGADPKQIVTLSIAGRKHQCETTHVHSRNGISAFSILHTSSPATLLFLRDSIEPMRQGSSLAKVPANLLKEEYADGTWTYLRGEGPTDLLIRSGADGTLTQALMTLSRDAVYNEIRYDHGRLSTGISLDRQGMASSRMAAHSPPNLDVLHHGAAILLCANANEVELLIGQFLREILNAKTIEGLSQTRTKAS